MKLHTWLITGTHPVMMHTPEAMQGPEPGANVKRIPTAKEEAEAGRYIDTDGNLYLPTQGFKSCMVSALKGRRLGKVAAGGVVKSTVFPAEPHSTVLDAKNLKPKNPASYSIDTRRVVLKKTIGIVRSRPTFTDWACKVVFEVDDDIFKTEKELAILTDALNSGGKMVGVGDYRPEKGGPFGRFEAKLLTK